MTRRIAVTGATGFIGRHLVADLASRGDEVVPVGRPRDRAALAAAFRNAEAVVHLAGVVSAVREGTFAAVNVEGTRAVAEAAQASGARLIHVSSLAAAGPAPAAAPRSEDDAPRPVTPYGRSKLQGERVVASTAGLRWIVLRPGIVYGPGDRAMLPLFQLASHGLLPLTGRADAAYTIVHVGDVVRSLIAALDSDADRETLFVGHTRPAGNRELLEAVRSAVGRPALIVRVPMAVTRLAAWAGDIGGALRGRPLAINSSRYVELAAEGFVCRVDRLRDRLGIVAGIDLREGFAETAAWYRLHEWM